MRIRAAIVGLALLGALLAIAQPGSAAAGKAATIRIKNVDFKPHVLKVDRGTRVTWTFLDRHANHNVRSTGRLSFRPSGAKREGTHSVAFRKPGSYRYRCTIHPGMKARVEVQ